MRSLPERPRDRFLEVNLSGAITSRSLDETLSWKAVGGFAQEGLVMGLPTAKRVEADRLGVEIDTAANEPTRPQGVDREGTAQQADGPRLRTAAEKDDRADRMGLQVRSPGGRERPPCGRRLDTGDGALAVRADIAPGIRSLAEARRPG